MKRYVLDASVILKWVLEREKEPDHEKAIGLLRSWERGEIELYTPNLWIYEVANILGTALPVAAADKMRMLLDLRISDVECSQQMISQCFTWTRERKATFYDAVYLAAAYAIDAVLLTADVKFSEKMNNDPRICLLTSYK